MSRTTGLRVVLPHHLARGPSPTPDSRHRLQVPSSSGGGGGGGGGGGSTGGNGGPSDQELWGEEESELIRSCAALSSALGVHKSFSTSDISGIGVGAGGGESELSRTWASEVTVGALTGRLETVLLPRLDPTSRSCSTWVAVGDVASTSQLPSPQARPGALESPAFTAADFIRSVNKKVRQNYIKRRLVTTYQALQRLSQSELNLQMAGASVTVAGAPTSGGGGGGGGGNGGGEGGGGTEAPAGGGGAAKGGQAANQSGDAPNVTTTTASGVTIVVPPRQAAAQDVLRIIRKEVELPAAVSSAAASAHNKNLALTARDVERDRGRPLTKYERNMMIFNWLQTLEETSYDGMT